MAKNRTRPFKFKRFEVKHTASAHKVGVDGVLVGLWTSLPSDETPTILDVGCGCGVITLILAQRCAEKFQEFHIDAIDIDLPSVVEAKENFDNSPWASMLKAEVKGFEEISKEKKYSLIISNPPYFSAGVSAPSSRRELARHCGSLSPTSLIEKAGKMLTDKGRLSMILPNENMEDLITLAAQKGLRTERTTYVKGNQGSPVKRVLIEFCKSNPSIHAENKDIPVVQTETLILETSPGTPTEEYRQLGHPFYLYF